MTTDPSSSLSTTAPPASASSSPSWSISVKTVGGGFEDCTTSSSTTSSSGERLFNVIVSPEDGVSSLYEEIEGATGVKVSQQRLIYRGRIINDHHSTTANNHDSSASPSTTTSKRESHNNDSSSSSTTTNDHNHGMRKIKDIAGLCDGQTIHLVKKRDVSSSNSADNSNNNESNEAETNNSRSSSSTTLFGGGGGMRNGGGTEGRNALETDTGGGGGGALLAALLGLGSDIGLGGNTLANATTGTTTSPSTASWRTTNRSRSHRRPHYRLSAADLEVPNPGSMEPVRQGLMTLHTLLPHSELYSENGTSPLQANREFFRGQWIDCRDTVNQWLEATIVEILQPEDVLPSNSIPSATLPTSGLQLYPQHRRRAANVDDDPAISSNDLEGRRRLLLERCDQGDPNELSGDLVGFRPRSTNGGVQLLLVHYNGWPRRWDEWM